MKVFRLWVVTGALATMLGGASMTLNAATDGVALTKQQLTDLEMRRADAITHLNIAVLNEVLADDYVHVHSVGAVNNKAEFIEGIQARPRGVERGPLTIRVYGDVAIITGEQRNIRSPMAPPPADAAATPPANGGGSFFATEIAHKEHGKWRIVSMHVTTKAANPGR